MEDSGLNCPAPAPSNTLMHTEVPPAPAPPRNISIIPTQTQPFLQQTRSPQIDRRKQAVTDSAAPGLARAGRAPACERRAATFGESRANREKKRDLLGKNK